jgi:spore germination protein PF
MPSIVGPIKINSVDGVLNTGDAFNISPKTTAKTNSGSGGFNTGDFQVNNNGISITNTVDPDVSDSNNAGNV